MHQHEATRAIGVFNLSCFKTSLTKQSALLIAGHAANRHVAAQPLGLCSAKVAGRRLNLRQHRRRNAKQGQQLIVPAVGVHIKKHGACCIADIGCMHSAATELPHQPRVHRAKRQLPRFGHGARARHVVQDPLQFGRRKIGVKHQASFLLHHGCKTRLAQAHTFGLRPPVLPNNGVVNGLAGVAPPHQCGFALIGDAHGGNLFAAQARLLQNLSRCGELAGPYFLRVVLYPARLGVNLLQFHLCLGHHIAPRREHNASAAGCTLV